MGRIWTDEKEEVTPDEKNGKTQGVEGKARAAVWELP